MSDEALRGSMQKTPFVRSVGTLIRTKATGVLEIKDALGVNRAFFLEGVPQGANLARLKHPIGRLLVTENIIDEQTLSECLGILNRTGQLLGQILLDKKVIQQEQLLAILSKQSHLNFLSLFGSTEGKFEFHEGLVHLKDYSTAPADPLTCMYEGLRDFGSDDTLGSFSSSVAFCAVKVGSIPDTMRHELDPAEAMLARLLEDYRFSGDLARRVPLSNRCISAFLCALDELELLERSAAHHVSH